jgi:steroid delta-isomerase-like uncharacterized protein
MATPTIDTLRARRDRVVDAHIAAEAVQHDVTAALSTFHHPRYEVSAMGAVVDGRDGVQGLLTGLLTAFPDFWLEKTAPRHADDAVIVECRFGGMHRGPWVGIEATGKQMAVQAVCIFAFEGEKLVCEKVYFDHVTVRRQLSE